MLVNAGSFSGDIETKLNIVGQQQHSEHNKYLEPHCSSPIYECSWFETKNSPPTPLNEGYFQRVNK